MVGRFSWVLALVVLAVSGALMGSDRQRRLQRAVAGPGARQCRIGASGRVRAQLPGGDQRPRDRGLQPPRRRRADPGRSRRDQATARRWCPTTVGPRWRRCRWTPACPASPSTMRSRRCANRPPSGLPDDLRVEVTGGPAFGADIANSFSGANITLLAVTAAVVALLLIVTYRSPVLWLVPLAVIGFADRVAAVVGSAVAAGGRDDSGRLDLRHHQRAGIRRGHQLRAAADLALPGRVGPHARITATRCGVAVRRAGPAILASNATVVLALLTLRARLVAEHPQPRRAGRVGSGGRRGVRAAGAAAPAGACSAAAVLAVRPARSARNPLPTAVFGTASPTRWHARPARVTVGRRRGARLLCLGLLATPIGLSQTEQFRVQAESVSGYETLAAHFPSGLTDPTRVIAATGKAAPTSNRRSRPRPAWSRRTRPAQSRDGLSQWSVVLSAEPASDEAFETIDALRDSVQHVGSGRAGRRIGRTGARCGRRPPHETGSWSFRRSSPSCWWCSMCCCGRRWRHWSWSP